MENTQNLNEQTGLMGNKELQNFIRKSWRAYTKAQPKKQTAQELMAYHFLRFGHANKCFTQITNSTKLTSNYCGDPLWNAKMQKQHLEYSIRLYEKSSLTHPKEFMSHIWGKEFIEQHIRELSQMVAFWKVEATKPYRKEQMDKAPIKTQNKELTQTI